MSKTTPPLLLLVLFGFALTACSDSNTVTDADVSPDSDAMDIEDASSEDSDSEDASTDGPTDDGSTDDASPPDEPPTSGAVSGPASSTRVSSGVGGLPEGLLDAGDRFGRDHDQAGDINGDGVTDWIVGARSDDDGQSDAGAAYVLFMNADGTVMAYQKISALEGGLDEVLGERAFFGYGVAGLGDYNDDGIPDIAVSALGANPTIYVLHLNRDGTVGSKVKNEGIIAQGLSAADINEDGKLDLIAAEPNERSGGAIRLLFLDESSTVIEGETVTISSSAGGFGEGLSEGDSFGGRESALLGDIDGDGTLELAVGAFQSDGGTGAIWILSLDHETYEVVDKRKVGPGLDGFDETIPNDTNNNGTTGGHFGHALVAPGDLNADGVPDLITGANQYGKGVGYVLYLNADKSVRTFTRITEAEGGFDLTLGEADRFSRSMALVDQTEAGFILNMGGGVSVGGSGAIYSLTFQTCSVSPEEGNTFWSGGETLFSNWDHGAQTVTGPLSFEQCVLKAFENDASKITAKASDGRCIIKGDGATLEVSEEGSQSFVRACP